MNTPDEQDRFLNEGRFKGATENRMGPGWIVLWVIAMILPLPGGFFAWWGTSIWISVLVVFALLVRMTRRPR